MAPIAIYLDTSDFARLYRPSTPQDRDLRDELLRRVEAGQIAIGLSYFVVFELLQSASPRDRQDRVSRALFLRELCAGYAFPHPADFSDECSITSDGIWYPKEALRDVEIEKFVCQLRNGLYSGLAKHLPRNQRRQLRTPKGFSEFVRQRPDLLAITPETRDVYR